MNRHKQLLVGYKVFFGLLGFSAIVTEMATIVERGVFNAANFFSYFTIESNILVVITLLLSAFYLAMNKNARWLDQLRGAVTVYIAIVGLGFSFLLAGLEGVALTAVPWDNTVLHYIIPVAVFLDYLIDRPQYKLLFKTSILWLLFPITYLVYSLVRGGITSWYPYPFLNPAHSSVESIILTGVCLLALGLVITLIVTSLSGASTKVRSR